MTARINDTRVFGSEEDADDVSFADPEAAVESRLREMRLSRAGHDIEQRIREQDTPTTSMANAVEGEVDERIKDNPDHFIREEPEAESEADDEGESDTNADVDTGTDDMVADDADGDANTSDEPVPGSDTGGEETDEQRQAEADGEDGDAQQVTFDDRWG